jgi:hypothetical protein
MSKRAGGVPLKERCMVCNHILKRRKWRRAGIGPACAEKLARGYAGIQLNAFEPIPEVVKKTTETS